VRTDQTIIPVAGRYQRWDIAPCGDIEIAQGGTVDHSMSFRFCENIG
jgi:hypothetical protein